MPNFPVKSQGFFSAQALFSENLTDRVAHSGALPDLQTYRSELILEIKASRIAFLESIEVETRSNPNAVTSGIATGRQIALWHDQTLQYLARLCFPERSGLCLMAVGGYGLEICAQALILISCFLGQTPH